MRIRKTRAVATALAAVLMMQIFPAATLAAASISDTTTSSVFVPIYAEGSYGEYLQNYAREKTPTTKINLDITDFEGSENVTVETVEGRENVVVTQEDSVITYRINVESSGLYAIGINYYPMEGKSAHIQRRILVNGELLYSEAGTAMIPRRFVDDVADPSDKENYFPTDTLGGQVRPAQKEIRKWFDDEYFIDSSGVYGTPLKFYLDRGENTITFESIREPLAYSEMWICGYEETQSYEDMLLNNSQFTASGDRIMATAQAEMPSSKSSSSLVAGTDKSSSATVPSSSGSTKLNIMGSLYGEPTWEAAGEWVEYTVNVEEAGLYKLVLRSRQNVNTGMFSSREITVNGEKPYKGMTATQFAYSSSWQFVTPCDEYGDPLLYKFNKGENTIRIKVVYGAMSEVINAVDSVIEKLNADYRRLLMIIGYSPDLYYDYELDQNAPEVVADLKAQADVLKRIYNEVISVTGELGELTAQLQSLYSALYSMYENPDSIPANFANLSTNIGTLGQWQSNISSQPLELDYIMVTEKDYTPGKAENGFFADLGHQIQLFFSSFFTDVNAISSSNASEYTNKIKVWMTSSRDEATILRSLIDRTFVEQNKVYVQLDLVNDGAIYPSILAQIGPDVVLDQASPIGLACRNALQDLNGFENIEEVKSWFLPEAFVGLTLDWDEERSGLYGLPTTESLLMAFYREDVFKELGVEIPKTWDEVYEILIPLLQKRNMQLLAPSYELLLYQNGGSYYRNNGTYTDIDSAVGISSFIEWTDFYVAYKSPITANFDNRFRYGEMPYGLQDISYYGTISLFAPEIVGLWTIGQVPGKVREDGSVYNSVGYSTKCDIMLDCSKDKESAWKFMVWRATADTQASLARDMESLLGVGGRRYSANTEALQQGNWTAAELKAIMAQRENVYAIPSYVGTYLMDRYITMTFNSVVNDDKDVRETLLDYIKEINDEIVRKREEYGIKVYTD